MRFFVYGILLLLHQAVYAATISPVVPSASPNQTIPFDVKDANKQFDKLNIQLSTQNLNLDTLSVAIKTLNKLITTSNDCVDSNEKRLNALVAQIQQSITINNPNPAPAGAADVNKSEADLVYLNTERKKLTTQLSQCRLFSIRAKEAVDAYTITVAKLKHDQTITRGLPLWSMLKAIQMLPNDTPLISANLRLPQQAVSPLLWAGMAGFSLIVSILFMRFLRRQSWTRRYLRIQLLHPSQVILFALCLMCGMLTGQLKILATQNLPDLAIPLDIMTTLSIYTFGLVLISLIFTLKWVGAFFYWYSLDHVFFRSLSIFLLGFESFVILIGMIAKHISINALYWQFGITLFLFAVLITAIYFVYYFCRAHQHIPFIKSNHRWLKQISLLVFLVCASIDVLGYHSLAKHLTFGFITTFGLLFTAWLLDQAVNKCYQACIHFGIWHNKINRIFGYKTHQTPAELFILKVALQLCIFSSTFYLITHFWGYADYYIESIYRQILFGFHFANFTFYPTRIIAGVIVFCLLYLLCRALSSRLSRHTQFEDEEESQVAIASILSYIGFAIALVAGLLLAGFNFTGLAIIAGALSVGIGLGLQSIVNNFVSGIILLIEKPIKPGDRIRVDNIEGIVKKIRVRSTQITTSAREDVIIPNSDLITHPVTNFMYSDKHLSIHCTVCVAYDSDTQLVRDLLLQVTQKHEDIIRNTRHKPTVFFKAFSDHGLIFQVWFLIKDGNRKADVQSALHFEIDRIFREHHVQFALPQRDIHIKMNEIKS